MHSTVSSQGAARILLLTALVVCECVSSTKLVLWRNGEERYRTLIGVVGHEGSCEPSCVEKRDVVVPPNVFYKVKVEVAQVDMHSKDEHVNVKVGGQSVTCSPKVASDYNCSLIECGNINFGRVVNSEVLVEVQAFRTRDTCKCAASPQGDVDCYSELLSGLDAKYGAFVRLTFEPQVSASWVTGDWGLCDQIDCITPTATTNRSVQCRVFDPGDVGDGGERCAEPTPESVRFCQEAPECIPPDACDDCFSMAHLRADRQEAEMNWSAIVMYTATSGSVFVDDTGRPLQLRLLRGQAQVSCSATFSVLPAGSPLSIACISLVSCDTGKYLVRRFTDSFRSFSDLMMSEDDGSFQFRMQATFHLKRVAAAGYVLADPYHGGEQSPPFAVAQGVPTVLASGTDQSSQSCSLDLMLLGTTQEMCRASTTYLTCPDASDGAFGRCCVPGSCPTDAIPPPSSCSTAEGSPGLALVMAGFCEDVRCSPIEGREECERAAAAMGFTGSGGTAASAQLRVSNNLPLFCSWEYATADNGFPVLWLNKIPDRGAEATERIPQICRCGEARPSRIYTWSQGEWSACSRTCGKQMRYRRVVCHELIGTALRADSADFSGATGSREVEPIFCRQAGLEEPYSSEPCSTQVCWAFEDNTRCAGTNRLLTASEVHEGAWLVEPPGNGTAAPHCVAMNTSSVAAVANSVVPKLIGMSVDADGMLDQEVAWELCRVMCTRLGNCVGFTFFAYVRGDPNSAQCCFLRRASRWQPNFRRATCHLAQGMPTRNGCYCQVGWEMDPGDDSMVCGGQRRGCCTTPDSGARSWCPTTSPSCGTQRIHQKHSDVCDLAGVAAVSAYTCRSHQQLAGRNCASARGISECNQIATVLGLPDTTPSLTLRMDMPSGCVWQKSTSQLWLNQLVDAVNASDPTQKVSMTASAEMAELCSCPPSEELRWEVTDWGPCHSVHHGDCYGARQRERSVFCVRANVQESNRREVVADSLCQRVRPEARETCNDCSPRVLKALAEFSMDHPVPGLKEPAFKVDCHEQLAHAANLDTSRISIGKVECCTAALKAELLVSDGLRDTSGADALDRLTHISRSAAARSQVVWTDGFGTLMQFFSLRVLGSFAWDISDAWGPCSQKCGGGVQTRDVWCSWTDFENEKMVVEDLKCDAATRPAQQRACSEQACQSCPPFHMGPQYVVSGGKEEMAHANKVYVTCAAGYGTVDDVRLVESECQDGEWSPLAVSCGRSCPAFVSASWKYEVHGTGFEHGSTRQVTCKRGESDDMDSVEAPPSASVICQDGAWTTPWLVCTGDCLTPELTSAYAVNGSKGDNIAQKGSVWHISCAAGYASAAQPQQPVQLQCVEGSWSGLEDIPDCKADCPRYKLSEGYEVVGAADAQYVAASILEDTDSWSSFISDDVRRMQINITGVPHGTHIGIRCVDGYGRVPGAVERVECNDGQWSPLSLYCAKDCKPFNATVLEQSRFRVIRDMSQPNGESMEPSAPTAAADAPHGSKVIIGCKLEHGEGEDSERAMKRGAVTCANGRWIPSDLRCFSDCEAFVPGPEYSVLIPGALASQRNRSVPHGTQLLATCAQGFSALPPIGFNSSASTRGASALIEESECVDGTWTSLMLRCFQDCPSWPMHQHLIVDSGGGLRVGSILRLACAQRYDPDVTIRCGTLGSWELLEEYKFDVDTVKFQVGQTVDKESFASVCPYSTLSAKEDLMKMTFWSKLSDDERAMFMILALGCFGSLTGLACTYFLSPHVSNQEQAEEEDSEDETEEAETKDDTTDAENPSNPSLRRFNLLTGELETREREARAGGRRRRQRRRRGAASRIARAVERRAGRLASWLQDQTPPATCCSNCDQFATHVCFPCSHLCLCLACAEDLIRSTGRGFQEVLPADRSDAPTGRPSCPLCGQFVFCVIDAKPAKVFEVPGPLDMAVSAAAAAASSLRRTAATAARGAADVASRHAAAVSPTMMGRSRSDDARPPPPHWNQQ